MTPRQEADDSRMKLLSQWSAWVREPVDCEGPFDFSDLDYFRRGVQLYGELIRRRYTRSRPANTWFAKSAYGMRAMLARLEACVDMGAIYRAETAVRRDHGG